MGHISKILTFFLFLEFQIPLSLNSLPRTKPAALSPAAVYKSTVPVASRESMSVWGTALFFGIWHFPISALGATSDLRTPSTERDTDKVRLHQIQSHYNHSLLHSLLYISLPWNYSIWITGREIIENINHFVAEIIAWECQLWVPFVDI